MKNTNEDDDDNNNNNNNNNANNNNNNNKAPSFNSFMTEIPDDLVYIWTRLYMTGTSVVKESMSTLK